MSFFHSNNKTSQQTINQDSKWIVCDNIFYKPVTLQCGHFAYKTQVDEFPPEENKFNKKLPIKCIKCNKTILVPQKKFIVRKVIDFKDILINEICDSTLKLAQDQNRKLNKLIELYELKHEDQSATEFYSKLRVKVNLIGEGFVENVNKAVAGIINELDESEKKCKQILIRNNFNQTLATSIQLSKDVYEKSSHELKGFSLSEDMLKRINKEIELEQNKIQTSLIKFNKIISNPFREGTVDLINADLLFADELSRNL